MNNGIGPIPQLVHDGFDIVLHDELVAACNVAEQCATARDAIIAIANPACRCATFPYNADDAEQAWGSLPDVYVEAGIGAVLRRPDGTFIHQFPAVARKPLVYDVQEQGLFTGAYLANDLRLRVVEAMLGQ